MYEVTGQDADNLTTENIAYGTSVATPSVRPPVATSSNVAYDVGRQVKILQNPAAAAHGDEENCNFENDEHIYEPLPDSN